jgi:hypothetical protein
LLRSNSPVEQKFVISASFKNPPTLGPSGQSAESGALGLGGGAIAGIVIGSVAGGAIIAAVICVVFVGRKGGGDSIGLADE